MRGWSYNVLYVYRRTTNANDDDDDDALASMLEHGFELDGAANEGDPPYSRPIRCLKAAGSRSAE